MKMSNPLGYSQYTSLKQQHFGQFVSLHLGLSSAVMKKNRWILPKYYYFDLNAGPGFYHGIQGSPIVFLRQAVRHREMDFDIVLIEKCEEFYDRLQNNIVPYHSLKIRTFNQDHLDVLPRFCVRDGASLGLIYTDPSGETPPFSLLEEISKYRKRIDLLIHFTGANIKRICNSPLTSCNKRLLDFLSPIEKKQWLIREPYARHQWSFLFGTNWTDFPAYEKIGFHKLNSDKGKAIFEKLNYTNEELTDENRTNQNGVPFQGSFSY
jgi:three-Cys-motif partner protein